MPVFETGLPTRSSLNRTEVDRLVPSDTVTACPDNWTNQRVLVGAEGGDLVPDLAWAYDVPTLALQPIAGLIAFSNEGRPLRGRRAARAAGDPPLLTGSGSAQNVAGRDHRR